MAAPVAAMGAAARTARREMAVMVLLAVGRQVAGMRSRWARGGAGGVEYRRPGTASQGRNGLARTGGGRGSATEGAGDAHLVDLAPPCECVGGLHDSKLAVIPSEY
nr:hypothetical protein GCM10025732_54020 [Glycomyces mayteni]